MRVTGQRGELRTVRRGVVKGASETALSHGAGRSNAMRRASDSSHTVRGIKILSRVAGWHDASERLGHIRRAAVWRKWKAKIGGREGGSWKKIGLCFVMLRK